MWAVAREMRKECVGTRRVNPYRAVFTEVARMSAAFVRARTGVRSDWFRCGRKPNGRGVGN